MADSPLVPAPSTPPALPDATTEVALAPDAALVSRIRREIHLNDHAQLIVFGDQAQRNVASYADQILRNTVNRDSGSVGGLLTNLLTSVNKLDPESLELAWSEHGFRGKLGSIGKGGPAVEGLAPFIASVVPIPDATVMLALVERLSTAT